MSCERTYASYQNSFSSCLAIYRDVLLSDGVQLICDGVLDGGVLLIGDDDV